MAQPMSNEDRFQISCNQLREFIVFRDRLPKQGSQNKVECQLATFVGTQRKAHGHNKLPKDRETVLNNVNPGILAWKLQLMNNNQPSDKWKTVFDGMAGRNTPHKITYNLKENWLARFNNSMITHKKCPSSKEDGQGH